jgi:hypothetical protein
MAREITQTFGFENAVSTLNLLNQPIERLHCLPLVRNDRREQVCEVIMCIELNLLWVNENETQPARIISRDEGSQNVVQQNCLARANDSSNNQVRQGMYVCNYLISIAPLS